MVRQREFDVEEALDAGYANILGEGFEATSLSDLHPEMAFSAAKHISTFGDKKELFEAALRKYTRTPCF